MAFHMNEYPEGFRARKLNPRRPPGTGMAVRYARPGRLFPRLEVFSFALRARF
jgi:hypothetical protein